MSNEVVCIDLEGRKCSCRRKISFPHILCDRIDPRINALAEEFGTAKSSPDCNGALGNLLGKRFDTQHLSGHL